MKARVVYKGEDGRVYLAKVCCNYKRAVEVAKEMNEKENTNKYFAEDVFNDIF